MSDKTLKILVVDDESTIREILTMIIEASFDELEVIEAENGEEAIDYLNNETFIAIFCDFRMPKKNGGDVFQFNSTKGNLPFALISTERPDDHKTMENFEKINTFNRHFIKPFDDEQIVGYLKEVLNSNSNTIPTENDYCKVKISNFINIDHAAYDMFLKINKDKFLKIFKKGDEVNNEQLRRYIEKDNRFLYLKRLDAEKMMLDIVGNLHKHLKSKNFVGKKLRRLQKHAIGKIHEFSKHIGFVPAVCEVIEESIDSIINDVKKVENLDIINDLMSKTGYIYDHICLSSYLAGILCSNMDWSSSYSIKKLTTAALFSNVSLDSHYLASMQTNFSKEFKELNVRQRKIITSHAEKSVNIYDRYPNSDNDVVNLILKHHERPDGKGFPKGINENQLSPLESIFIIAGEISHQLLSLEEKTNEDFTAEQLDQVILDTWQNFGSKSFLKPLKLMVQKYMKNLSLE